MLLIQMQNNGENNVLATW